MPCADGYCDYLNGQDAVPVMFADEPDLVIAWESGQHLAVQAELRKEGFQPFIVYSGLRKEQVAMRQLQIAAKTLVPPSYLRRP